MSIVFELDASAFDNLQQAMKEYAGNTEDAVNEILHEQAGPMIKESIKNLIPVSGRTWKGKKKAAKSANSLKSINSNLAVTITTTSNYQYLYFPNDGTSTQNHVGNKQFFKKGTEKVTDEIINLCITRLTEI
jgi:HK97 gp10 family phage protein